jgi:hypothetical protein
VVPSEVDRIVMRCLERQPTDRYQSAAELAAALDEVMSASEEAVTTVDLTHPRGGVTTIKGMRVPARPPPALTPPPPIADPAARPTVQVDLAPKAPIAPAPPVIAAAPAPEATAAEATAPVAAAAAAAAAAAEAAATANAVSEATDRDAPALGAATEPLLPLLPSPRTTPTHAPAGASGLPQLTPSVPSLAPVPTEPTLIGLPNPRPPAQPARASRGSRPRMPPNGTPQSLSRITSNLREAYPTIHRSPPSPLRHQPSAFDDRPQSSVGGPVFRASHRMPRDAFVRQLILGVAIATAVLVAFLLLTW